MDWKRLVYIFIVIILFIIILRGIYISHDKFKKFVIHKTQQQLLTVAKTTAGRLEDQMDHFLCDLKNLAEAPEVQEICRKGIRQKANESSYNPLWSLYKIHAHETDALTILDANGIMLYRYPFIKKPDRKGSHGQARGGICCQGTQAICQRTFL